MSEYSNLEAAYSHHQELFYVLSSYSVSSQRSATSEPVVFEIAVGSYDEVVDWWNRGQIDAAVLAATPTATLIASDPAARNKLADAYIATLGERHRDDDPERPLLNAFCDEPPGAGCHDALSEQRRTLGARYYYRSLALVNREQVHTTDFRKVADLKPQYLFVRPGSASGYVLPLSFLQQAVHKMPPEAVPFLYDFRQQHLTYQHTNSLIELLKSNIPTVAFVYDSVQITDSKLADDIKAKLERLHGTDLDKTKIPFNALFINYNRPKEVYERNKKTILAAISRLNSHSPAPDLFADQYRMTGYFILRRFSKWISAYDPIVKILSAPPPQLVRSLPVLFNFSQIADELDQYAECKREGCERIPRLAVVLSGGGAKCAYQAGALEGIEQVLESRRKECRSNDCKRVFDIHLLVGTSGGSINALLAATANTATTGGRANLERVWSSLNQNELVVPSNRLRFWMSAAFGMFQALIISVLVAIFATFRWWGATLLELILVLLVVLLTLFFFVSGGRFVPVVLLGELVVLLGVILIPPVKRFVQARFGRQSLYALMGFVLIESIVFSYIEGELTTHVALIIISILTIAALALVLLAALTRYLLRLSTLDHLAAARAFATIILIILTLLELVLDLNPLAVDGMQANASHVLRALSIIADVPVSYAIPIRFGLVLQLAVLMVLVLLDPHSRKLRLSRNWYFYAVVVLLATELMFVPIPKESGIHKDLVLTSIQICAVLLVLQGTVWLAFFLISKVGLQNSGRPTESNGATPAANQGTMHWWTAAATIVFGVSVIEFCVALIWVLLDYWSPVVEHRVLHLGLVFILMLIFHWLVAGPVLIGVLMLLIVWLVEVLKVDPNWSQQRALLLGSLAGLTFALGSLSIAILFFLEVSISGHSAIASRFAQIMPTVVAGIDPQKKYTDLKCSNDLSLCTLSRQIVTQNLIRRDLLITASRLHDHTTESEDLPDDLYFYFKNSRQDVPWDARFVPLEDNPDHLLDVVIGSSTIYPVFPPRRLNNISIRRMIGGGLHEERELEIIDGGFIHNSPIEAAVSWGATHILLIEASPPENGRIAHSFAGHVANAFDYLFSQAQRTDISSKGSVELFELRPDPENYMDVMDFNPKLLQSAIQRGKLDAADGDSIKPKFHRVVGAPVFRPQYQPLIIRESQPTAATANASPSDAGRIPSK